MDVSPLESPDLLPIHNPSEPTRTTPQRNLFPGARPDPSKRRGRGPWTVVGTLLSSFCFFLPFPRTSRVHVDRYTLHSRTLNRTLPYTLCTPQHPTTQNYVSHTLNTHHGTQLSTLNTSSPLQQYTPPYDWVPTRTRPCTHRTLGPTPRPLDTSYVNSHM